MTSIPAFSLNPQTVCPQIALPPQVEPIKLFLFSYYAGSPPLLHHFEPFLVVLIYCKKTFQQCEFSVEVVFVILKWRQDFSALNWLWIIQTLRTPHWYLYNKGHSYCCARSSNKIDALPLWFFHPPPPPISQLSYLPLSPCLWGAFFYFYFFSLMGFLLIIPLRARAVSCSLSVVTVFPWHLVKTASCMHQGPTISVMPLRQHWSTRCVCHSAYYSMLST